MKNNKIIRICHQRLIYLRYAESTINTYLHYIGKFVNSIEDKQPIHFNSNDFQNYLDNFSFTSVSQQNQVINAIRFLYKYGLERKHDKVKFERPRKEKKLPIILPKEELIAKLEAIPNLKHRVILSLAYSTGMRVSEVCNVKANDIDSNRMLITIKQSKGNKDRLVPLSEKILDLLRSYYIEYNPKGFLFNGQSGLKYTSTSCQKIYKKYIDVRTSFHNLRHSCFTHLLESGVDLRVIQKIAGHSSSKTTEVYTHVSNKYLSKVVLPI